MLDSFRALSSSLLAKILLAILVVSFGIWGIGDMLRHPGRNVTVATIGNVAISSDEFTRSLRHNSELIRSQMGDSYSPELLKSMHLPQQVLHEIITKTLIRLESESLGLVPSDADVVRRIRSNPIFQDIKGNFDKTIFENTLQRGSVSEKSYVDQQRREMASALLIDTILATTPISDTMVRTMLQIQEEQRSITLYTLSPSAVSGISQPTEAQITEYYDTHHSEFTTPEYRKLSYITITAADVHNDTSVSEDELRAAYKERIDEFKHAERRTVEQLLYASEEDAKKAEELLKSGKNFDQVGKETGILNKGAISMGKVEKNNIFDAAADKVFSLKTGEMTDPIQSPFGWHIFRVTAVEPPSTAPFEEVRPMLAKDMSQRGADEALNKLANRLEDALAGGNTLQETARDLGLKIIPVGTISRDGKAPDGSKVTIPDLDKFVDTAFKTDEKTESPLTISKGGIYYTVHVDSIIPERLKTLDEVKGLGTENWQKEQRAKRLGEIAKEVSAKFSDKTARDAIIEKYGLKAMASAPIRRDSLKADEIILPPELVMDVFSGVPQGNTGMYLLPNGDYVIGVIDSIIEAPSPDKDPRLKSSLAAMHNKLGVSVQNELLYEYTNYLMGKYPVSVNDSALQSVLE